MRSRWTARLVAVMMTASLALVAMGCGQSAPTAPSPSYEMQNLPNMPVLPGHGDPSWN